MISPTMMVWASLENNVCLQELEWILVVLHTCSSNDNDPAIFLFNTTTRRSSLASSFPITVSWHKPTDCCAVVLDSRALIHVADRTHDSVFPPDLCEKGFPFRTRNCPADQCADLGAARRHSTGSTSSRCVARRGFNCELSRGGVAAGGRSALRLHLLHNVELGRKYYTVLDGKRNHDLLEK